MASKERKPAEEADELVSDLDEDTAIWLPKPAEAYIWDTGGDEWYILEKSQGGIWYPRPSIISTTMAKGMVEAYIRDNPDGDVECVDLEDVPEVKDEP